MTGYFSPHRIDSPAREVGCLSCRYNRGQRHCGHVVCERFEKVRVIGNPRYGCCEWEREPGADD